MSWDGKFKYEPMSPTKVKTIMESYKNEQVYDYIKELYEDPDKSGVSSSVSKLARDIYNSITNNAWVDHQDEFRRQKEIPKFTTNDYNS
jgi:hypothetical protein